jgi:hypothetical protein
MPATFPVPTSEQHAALLSDVREQLAALPTSGALNAGGNPYRAQRTERAVEQRAADPVALLAYVTKLAFQKTSETLTALVKADRLDLSIESLVADESKVYAPLFSDGARAAARAKLVGWKEQVAHLARERLEAQDAADRRIIAVMNRQRAAKGQASLTTQQEQRVLENRRRSR